MIVNKIIIILDRHSLGLQTIKNQKMKKTDKFLEDFIHRVDGIDVWRYLHPGQPNGFTRLHSNGSRARLDYFIMKSSWLSKILEKIAMFISHEEEKLSDHN